MIDLGPVTSFLGLSTPVTLANRPYYAVHAEGGYRLISRICAHMGGQVVDTGSCFECPQHGWRYNRTTGQGINVPSAQLSWLPITVRDGHLWVDSLPERESTPAASQRKTMFEQLSVQLHAHACLDFVYKGFSLLTDPWIAGPAFMGAWIQYPPPMIDVGKLHPDAILITHEHSDHFHEPTLSSLERSTPVYVPDFPNRRMVLRLEALGFVDVHPMSFGETYEISEGINLSCFEPNSLWNDSIVLIDIDGFRILNLNDAGLNHRIAPIVSPVDVIATGFSGAASGYPLTWTHLSEQEKIGNMELQCQGSLDRLREALVLYEATYLLPFASHFALWHPSHRQYAALMRQNTIVDVCREFEQSPTRLIDLLPGDTWDISDGRISRVQRHREELYDRECKLRYLETNFDRSVFEQHHPPPGDLTRNELEEYFFRLNSVPDIVFSEDLSVTVEAGSPDFGPLDVSFEIRGGRLENLTHPPETPNLRIKLPLGVLGRIVRENLNWDEATIGFWCTLERHPDVYNAGFWRLLQAPYFNKPARPPGGTRHKVSGDTVIADLIEEHGDRADRILRRYGLYCAGCHHSTMDSISQGLDAHGINPRMLTRLVKELEQVAYSQSES